MNKVSSDIVWGGLGGAVVAAAISWGLSEVSEKNFQIADVNARNEIRKMFHDEITKAREEERKNYRSAIELITDQIVVLTGQVTEAKLQATSAAKEAQLAVEKAKKIIADSESAAKEAQLAVEKAKEIIDDSEGVSETARVALLEVSELALTARANSDKAQGILKRADEQLESVNFITKQFENGVFKKFEVDVEDVSKYLAPKVLDKIFIKNGLQYFVSNECPSGWESYYNKPKYYSVVFNSPVNGYSHRNDSNILNILKIRKEGDKVSLGVTFDDESISYKYKLDAGFLEQYIVANSFFETKNKYNLIRCIKL